MWETVDKLGQWPILQIGLVAVIVIITIMTYARVIASKFPTAPSTSSNGVTEVSFMYFQGWFKSVLDGISELKTNQEVNRMQLREVFADELRKTRHELKNSFASLQAEIVGELESFKQENQRLERTVHDLQLKLEDVTVRKNR